MGLIVLTSTDIGIEGYLSAAGFTGTSRFVSYRDMNQLLNYIKALGEDIQSINNAIPVGGGKTDNSAAYTATPSDFANRIVNLSNAAARSVDLPNANSVPTYQVAWFKDSAFTASQNNITITPDIGTQKIEGQASIDIGISGGMAGVYSDGANYFVIPGTY
jgi:hypothetical protein